MTSIDGKMHDIAALSQERPLLILRLGDLVQHLPLHHACG
jgi:hypothetical protein